MTNTEATQRDGGSLALDGFPHDPGKGPGGEIRLPVQPIRSARPTRPAAGVVALREVAQRTRDTGAELLYSHAMEPFATCRPTPARHA